MKNKFLRIASISFCLAVLLIVADIFSSAIFPTNNNQEIIDAKSIETPSDIIATLDMSTEEELTDCLSDVECRTSLYLSAQEVQTELIRKYGQSWKRATTTGTTTDTSYKSEIEALTHGEAVLMDEQVIFNSAQLSQYALVLQRPYMKVMEKAFASYGEGSEMGNSDSSFFVTPRKHNDLTYGLQSFDKSYFESPFTPFGIYDHFLGGKDILVIFHKKPDRLFRVWVDEQVQASTTEWIPRAIHDTGIPKEEVQHLYWQYQIVDDAANELIREFEDLDIDIEKTLRYLQAVAVV